jgi:hypothetical protein
VAPLDRNRATRLLAMARYLGGKGVRPADVTLAHLEAYREALLNDRLRAKPEQTWDAIVWTWNACRREITGWPDLVVPLRDSARDLRSPTARFPGVAESRRRGVSPSVVRRGPERGRLI